MRVSATLATALLVASTACVRTPLQPPGHPHGGSGVPESNGAAGGAGGSANGTGGATAVADAARAGGGATSAGATAGTTVSHSTGGAVATGGVFLTGGARASGGSGSGGRTGTGGRAGSGGIGSGGRTATGGATSSGGRIGTGGGTGGAGFDAGSRDALASTGGTTASGGTLGQGGTGGAAAACGNGIVDPGEQCDLGADNQASAAFSVTQGGHTFAPLPLVYSDSGAAFYSYSSSSAHTGFEALGASRIMLHFDRSAFALSLIVFHGIDKDSTGEEQPVSDVSMWFSGLPETTAVNLADESNELAMSSTTKATAVWHFENNSDGGVLGGLPFPGSWAITIQPFFTNGISAWAWIEADGSLVSLDLTQPLTIESRSSHGQCRPDCTIPACGDAILDGGEICDDGRPSPSGCGMNCQSFN